MDLHSSLAVYDAGDHGGGFPILEVDSEFESVGR